MLAIFRFTVSSLMAGGQNTRKHTVKLLDWQILADVAVRPCPQSGVHLLLIVTDACENNDGQSRINFSHEGNERDSVDLRHLKIDNCHVAIVLGEPGGGLETFGQSLAGMPALTEISDQKLGDAGVVINDEELRKIAVGRVHWFYNFHNR